MMSKKHGSGQKWLETAISYLLIVGVIGSVALEITGVIIYYRSYGNLAILSDSTVMIHGHDFFSFIYDLFSGKNSIGPAIWPMTAGIILLILTPFVRVIVSVFYFGWRKNFKYVVITLFVLIVLTISLSLH
jgi:uncharacterized membrane protein